MSLTSLSRERKVETKGGTVHAATPGQNNGREGREQRARMLQTETVHCISPWSPTAPSFQSIVQISSLRQQLDRQALDSISWGNLPQFTRSGLLEWCHIPPSLPIDNYTETDIFESEPIFEDLEIEIRKSGAWFVMCTTAATVWGSRPLLKQESTSSDSRRLEQRTGRKPF